MSIVFLVTEYSLIDLDYGESVVSIEATLEDAF